MGLVHGFMTPLKEGAVEAIAALTAQQQYRQPLDQWR
jgi:hypothetical protein